MNVKLPERIFELLPVSVRHAVETCDIIDANTIAYLETRIEKARDPQYLTLVMLFSSMTRTRDGLEIMISLLENNKTEKSVRMIIAERLGEFGFAFSLDDRPARWAVKGAHTLVPRANQALELELKNAENAEDFIKLQQHFMLFQRRRIVGHCQRLLTQAISSGGDHTGADLLRHANFGLFFDGYVPGFLTRTFPHIERDNKKAYLRIAVIGDFGSGRDAQFKTAEAMRTIHAKRPFDFGLTLGDNFYTYGLDDTAHPRWRKEWEEPYGVMGIPFYAILGNHDYGSTDSPLAQIAYSQVSKTWEMPAPNYSVRAGPVHIFALDTNLLLDTTLEWLEKGLAESDAPWKVVTSHIPIYGSGYNSADLVARLLPVLSHGGATAYLAGHDHAMEEYTPQKNVRLFTLGGGGANLYIKQPVEDTIHRSHCHGFGILEIDNTHLALSFINDSGEEFHRSVLEV